MDEKDIQKQVEGTETFENQDVKALEEMRIKYETDLAKEKEKYSQLLAYTVRGGNISTEKNTLEKTPEERWKAACEIIRDPKSTNIQQAQALLEGDSIYRAQHGGRSLFCSEDGTLSDKEEKIADMVVDIIKDSLEKAEGVDSVYSSISSSKLN